MPERPHQHDRAEGRADRQQVDGHALSGQQQRPERPRQQHEGDRRDDRHHQREAAVDRAGEVEVLGADAADPRAGHQALHGGADPLDGLLAGTGAGPGHRRYLDQRGAGPPPGGLGGRDRRPHTRHPRQATRQHHGVGRGAGGDQHLDRREHPGRHPRGAQGHQPLVSRTAARQGTGLLVADLQAQREPAKDRQPRHGRHADRDRGRAQHHRAARAGHRPVDRLVAGVAGCPLLTPTGHQQQRVVDRHTQADQRDQVLHDQIHLGKHRQQAHQQQRRQDGHRGDQQRRQRQHRAEHQQQHRQRAQPADQRQVDQLGPCRPAIVVGAELVDAGHLQRGARRQRPAQRGRGRISRIATVDCAVVAEEHQAVSGPAVGRDQAPVTAAGI